MVRPTLSKAAEAKDRHLSKHWPGSSAGVNKSKLTGDEELDYEERAAEDARRELEEAQREDAQEAETAPEGEKESASSIDTSSTAAGASSTASASN